MAIPIAAASNALRKRASLSRKSWVISNASASARSRVEVRIQTSAKSNRLMMTAPAARNIAPVPPAAPAKPGNA
jgi:hypothetical protein